MTAAELVVDVLVSARGSVVTWRGEGGEEKGAVYFADGTPARRIPVEVLKDLEARAVIGRSPFRATPKEYTGPPITSWFLTIKAKRRESAA